MAELHGELAAAGGHGAEVADVTEHGAQRSLGLDSDAAGSRLLALDHATAAVEVSNNVTDFFIGCKDVEFHHRLKDLRGAFDHGLAIRGLGGDFEGEVLRSEHGASFGLPLIGNRVRLLVQVEGRRPITMPKVKTP